jgi:hypothetical protein
LLFKAFLFLWSFLNFFWVRPFLKLVSFILANPQKRKRISLVSFPSKKKIPIG